MENRCVCCNEVIPEGRQVCPKCDAFNELTTVRNIPCRRDCKDRSPECHGICAKYLAWKDAKARASAERNKAKADNSRHYTYKVAKIKKEERKH